MLRTLHRIVTPLVAALLVFGCDSERDDPVSEVAASEEAQRELLDLAYASASRFPVDPHIKNRSRSQQAVVEAALAAGDLERAVAYARGIENWRRGLSLAMVAYSHAAAGRRDAALALLTEAEEDLLGNSADENAQKWRADRVRSWIASTWFALGDEDKRQEYGADLESSELERISLEEGRRLGTEALGEYLGGVDLVLDKGDHERVRAVLAALTELHRRFYPDESLRGAIATRVDAAERQVARDLYVDAMLRMAQGASEAGDQDAAAAYVRRAQDYCDAGRWDADDGAILRSRLAIGWSRAGRVDLARKILDAASAEFDAREEELFDMFRASPLRSLAEGYLHAGELEKAADHYARAVEAGALNPNSRPRAIDLADTLCSMVLNGYRPTDSLRERMTEISDGLGNPW